MESESGSYFGLGLCFSFLLPPAQGQLVPVHARGVDLPPLVEGGDPWCEHDVEFLQEAKSTLPAGWVVASNSLLEQVPGDVEVRASLSELVDVPT